jgi:hypothetical protein
VEEVKKERLTIKKRPALMWITGSVDSPGSCSATLQSPSRWLPRAVVIGLAFTAMPTGIEHHRRVP